VAGLWCEMGAAANMEMSCAYHLEHSVGMLQRLRCNLNNFPRPKPPANRPTVALRSNHGSAFSYPISINADMRGIGRQKPRIAPAQLPARRTLQKINVPDFIATGPGNCSELTHRPHLQKRGLRQNLRNCSGYQTSTKDRHLAHSTCAVLRLDWVDEPGA
jgi:hypothetical protein